VKLYLDEDISPRVSALLRNNGVDAVSAQERNMKGASDEEQLIAATSEARVMVTRNRNDFITLTVRFYEDLRPHYGLIIVPHSIPGAHFNLLANLLSACVKEHPKGLEQYTIIFLSRRS
jgi:predicted nuclease of predicted toxin-antitoxin system